MKSQKPEITEDALLEQAVLLIRNRLGQREIFEKAPPGYFPADKYAYKLKVTRSSALRMLHKVKADKKILRLPGKDGCIKFVPHYKII